MSLTDENYIIGPFIGLTKNGIKICISFPKNLEQNKNINEVTCCLTDNNGFDKEESYKSRDMYNMFVFKFNLPKTESCGKYQYSFKINNTTLDLSGLSQKDCYFYAPTKSFLDEDYFVLLSCHNPDEADGKSTGSPWEMWDKLEQCTRNDKNCKLLLLGGDQVYCDEIAEEYIERLKGNDSKELANEIKEALINQYLRFWGDLSYRKCLARIPSLAMWDDHDITDGWGSRLESFSGNEIKESWMMYFEHAKAAFTAFQAVRNPESIAMTGAFTTFYDYGDCRFVLLDFRTERNAKLYRIWQDKHEKNVMKMFDDTPNEIKKVFLLSPVIAMRTNFKIDERATDLTKILFKLAKWKSHKKSSYMKISSHLKWLFAVGVIFAIVNIAINPNLITTLVLWAFSFFFIGTFLAGKLLLYVFDKITTMGNQVGLADDMIDSLSSCENRDSFIQLLNKMFEFKSRGKEVVMLSGDIHLGGHLRIYSV